MTQYFQCQMKGIATNAIALSFFGLIFLSLSQKAAAQEDSRNSNFLVTIQAPHRARIIDNDWEALYNYLQIISRAHRSIDIESFIFDPDKAGRLILQAVVKKADEGVKVRILVDYYSTETKPGLDNFFYDALAQHGIELRYFNVADTFEFWNVGFRDHRKLLAVDEREMFIGGRNIADSFFGMAEDINYLDRDIWLEGPIVQKAVRVFNLYWQSSVVSIPETIPPPTYKRSIQRLSSKHPKSFSQDKADFAAQLAEYETIVQRAQRALRPQPYDIKLKNKVIELGGAKIRQSPILEVSSVTLASDRPIPGDEGRVVFPYLLERLKDTKHSMMIENYLFLCKDEEKDMFLTLLKRNVQIDLLTNSFFSEPNFLIAELANSRQNMAAENGMNVFCYMDAYNPDIPDQKIWGIHTKNMVVDGRDSIIGSFNLDTRSAEINSEMVVIINDNPPFASLIEQSIRQRIKNAARMNEDGSYADGYHCHSWERMLVIVLRPLVEIFSDFF